MRESLASLSERARRANEWGRLRMASRVAAAVALLAGIAFAAGAPALATLALSSLLLAASVTLRWWRQLGVDAVREGLTLGALPLLMVALGRACGLACAPDGDFARLEGLCALAGVLAGAGLAFRVAQLGPRGDLRWALALGVTALTAALACASLGAGGALAALSIFAGLAAATGLASLSRALRPR